MIKLSEILHTIGEEKKEGLISIEKWKFPDVEHLVAMGFDFDDYYFTTNKDPRMRIYKKKEKNSNGNIEDYFFLEEPQKPLKKFKDFNDLIDYFDHYQQPEIDDLY